MLLSALKPSDAGIYSGIVARVWNLSNSPASCTLNLPGDAIDYAAQLTHIELPLTSLSLASGVVDDTLATQQLKTYALVPHSLIAQYTNHVYLPLTKK